MAMASESLKLLQKMELNIAMEIVRLCQKHDIEYFIVSGTMLGAVRHKGFIPWDDDMDIGMLRDHYDKFLSIAEGELPPHLRLITFQNTPEYRHYLSRVVDTETIVREEHLPEGEDRTHISVDVYPIDGLPNNPLRREIFYLRVLYHKTLLLLSYPSAIDRQRRRGLAERIILFIMRCVPVHRLTTPYRQMCILDRLLRSNDVYQSKDIGQILGEYRRKEIVPAECFGKGASYAFEGQMLRGVEKYHEYLSCMYGDYMTLPPPEKRKHHYKELVIHRQ